MIALLSLPHARLLAQPASVSSCWADHGSGSAHDVTLFSFEPPDGYFALSDYAQSGYESAGTLASSSVPLKSMICATAST